MRKRLAICWADKKQGYAIAANKMKALPIAFLMERGLGGCSGLGGSDSQLDPPKSAASIFNCRVLKSAFHFD